MIPVTAEQLADIVGGDLVVGDGGARIDDVVIDSRAALPGSLFVALPGERTDGHAFLTDAAGRGATACLVDARKASDVPRGIAAVAVDDCADALLGLGTWARDTVDPTVVAVTGSNGKTTTKDFIAAATGAGRTVVAPPGSYNNELGVPLTCCRLTLGTEVLVAELGARGLGHIAALATALRPDIGVVTTIAGAHLQQFRDIDTVARAKGELVEALPPDGLAILNADDPRVAALAARTAARVATYGRGEHAEWRAESINLDSTSRATFRVRGVSVNLPLPGGHHVGNALAALAVAAAVGVPLDAAAAALAKAPVSRWRTQLISTRAGVTVLNDAYNANPSSTAAALRTLVAIQTPGRRWAVLGAMAELGDDAVAEHRRIGQLAAELGVDGVVAVGPAAAYGGINVDDVDDAVDVLASHLAPGDVVLVKASRAAGLERVADELVRRFGGQVPGLDST